MNIHRIQNYLTLTLDDGTTFTTNECTDEIFSKIMQNVNDRDTLTAIFYPDYAEANKLKNRVMKSSYMTMEGNSIYIKSISELTVPQDFAAKLIDAEEAQDYNKVEAYLNFWTLLSLNPDSRVRNNTFWFINKWDIKLTHSGLIVAYRNADVYQEGSKFDQELTKFVTQTYWFNKQNNSDNLNNLMVICRNNEYRIISDCNAINEDDLYIGDLVDLYSTLTTDNSERTTVFTDHHSRKFRIRLGHIVQMPREQADSCQENECSRGLHCAGRNWLEHNYFGTVGMRVLVNPADIVAIPHNSGYGKMRTCAYYPVGIISYDKNGHIIDEGVEDGYEDDFINKICYIGTINNEDNDNYTLNIPDIAEVDKNKVYQNLKELALKCMSNRNS